MKTWHIRTGVATDLAAVAAWPRQGAAGEPGADDLWLIAEWQAATTSAPVAGATLKLRGPIGMAQLRHWYHVGCVVHAAPELQLFHRQSTLLMGNDYTGATELADAACDTAQLTLAEQAVAWRLLLHAGLLWLARERAQHADLLIAELPGLRDAAGQSPFWQGLGAHFYAEDPLQAQQRFGPRWRTDVAALLPRHPVYTSFLPPAAQGAIAQSAPFARGWRGALVQAGLRYGHHVALDDAGPVLEAHLDTLPGFLSARHRVLLPAARLSPGAGWWVLLDEDAARWRVARGELDGDALRVDADVLACVGAGGRPWAVGGSLA